MLTMIYGRGKSGKTRMLLQRVKDANSTGMASRILIVPEQLSHQTERQLSALCGDEISFVSEVLSFTRLTSRVFSQFGGGARPVLDQAGRILTAQQALGGILSQLKVFASAAGRPEFLESMVELIDELKSYHVTPEILQTASEQATGQFAEKLREIGLILSAYEGMCAAGAADPRDQLSRLLQKLETEDYAIGRHFFVDGFTDFSTQEMRILESLLKKSGHMTIAILCDDPYGRDALFAPGRETLNRLTQMAEACGQEVQLIAADYVRPILPEHTYLEQNLFSYANVSYEEKSEGIRYISCKDRLGEVRTCAGVLRYHAMNGMRYRDMMICCGAEGDYQSLMTNVCGELGIPLYTAEKTAILAHPAVGFALLALDAALNGMEVETVCACMKTGYSGISDDGCDSLENYAITWAVRGRKWERPWTQHPEGMDGRFTPKFEEILRQLNSEREKLAPLFSLKKELAGASNIREQIAALFRFLEAVELAQTLEREIQEAANAGNQEAVQRTSQVWDALISCLQQIDHVMGQQVPKDDLLYRILKLSLKQYHLGAIPSALDCVSFGSVASVRGKEPKLLYVLGLNEGEIPAVPTGGSLLSERERTILRDQMEITLAPDAEGVYQRELLKVYSAFTAPTEYLYLSDAEGDMTSALSPSFLMERIQGLYPNSTGFPPFEYALSPETAAEVYLSGMGNEAKLANVAAIGTLKSEIPALTERIGRGIELSRERSLTLVPDSAAKLFGIPVPLTASRLDELRKCPLEYFLDYGLKARIRKEATFDAAEFGTFVHYILEKSIPQWVSGNRMPMELETSKDIVRAHLNTYSEERFVEEERSARDLYLFRRNGEEAALLLRDISVELSKSEFVPCAYELYFGGKNGPPALTVQGKLGDGRLTGMVDRADLWRSENGDFVRIVDYKSGTKKFDFTDLANGVGMQMLLYLFALEQSGIQGVTEAPVPAGVLYVPAKHAFSEAGDSEEGNALRRSGLVLGEDAVLDAMESGDQRVYLPVTARTRENYTVTREQMKLLKHFVKQEMADSVDQILGGDFSPKPFYCGRSKDPCSYCDYSDVCQKDSNFRRQFYQKSISAKEFWNMIGDDTDE